MKSKPIKVFEGWDFYRTQPATEAAMAHMQGQREVYMQAIDKTLDHLMEAFDDPSIAQMPVQDYCMAAIFLAAVKMVEASGHKPTRRRVLGAVNFLVTRMQEELPDMAQHLGE